MSPRVQAALAAVVDAWDRAEHASDPIDDGTYSTRHLAESATMLSAMVDTLSWVTEDDVDELAPDDRELYMLLHLIAALENDVQFRYTAEQTVAEDGASIARIPDREASVLWNLADHGWLTRDEDGVYHATVKTREAINDDRDRRYNL